MVLQDTWLFGGSIRANIAYGNPDATEEQIITAARAAKSTPNPPKPPIMPPNPVLPCAPLKPSFAVWRRMVMD